MVKIGLDCFGLIVVWVGFGMEWIGLDWVGFELGFGCSVSVWNGLGLEWVGLLGPWFQLLVFVCLYILLGEI